MGKNMRLIDIFFPSNIKCIMCSKDLEDGYICDGCLKEIKFISHGCSKCGGSLIGDGDVCLECKKYDRVFDKGYCVCEYDGKMKEKILKFKNHNGKYLSTSFSQMMLDKYKTLNLDIDIVIPIPIHTNRRKERGFNQCELLVEKIAEYSGKVDINVIYRKKDTPHQVGLNRENRITNIENAFELCKGASVKGKDILLVDDIFTTGTTLDECAKYLKNKGAKKVYCLCLARTPIGNPVD